MLNKYSKYNFLIILLSIISLFFTVAFAQDAKDDEKIFKETKDAIAMGKKEFEQACSLCHGMDAKGKGLYTSVLKENPSDLTKLKIKNNNVFPFKKLYKIIDGREGIETHGTRVMPIWGNSLKSERWLDINPRYAETQVRGRIFEILLYLESIQDPIYRQK